MKTTKKTVSDDALTHVFKQSNSLTLPTLVVWAIIKLHATTRNMSVHSTKIAWLLENMGFVAEENERPFSRIEIRKTLKTLAQFDIVSWAAETVYRRGPKRGRKRCGGAFLTEQGWVFVRAQLTKHLTHVESISGVEDNSNPGEAITSLLAHESPASLGSSKVFADKLARRRHEAAPGVDSVPVVACASPVVLRRPDGVEYQFASVEAAVEFERLRAR